MADLQEFGVAALSQYDRKIASGGDDERAIQMSTWLVATPRQGLVALPRIW
jgi:hypothetical protein